MTIAIIGATGLVGQTMLKVLEERNLPFTNLLVAASDQSKGNTVAYNGVTLTLVSVQSALNAKPDIALFSIGAELSEFWAPQFASVGTTVIDNSSAWRMHDNIKLVVPEINAKTLTPQDKIIANPNCSTIQLVIALHDLHRHFGLDRLVISTYQSVSGSGQSGIDQLKNEQSGIAGEKFYPHTIHENALPQCDDFSDDGYTKEEWKLINETKKILNDNKIGVTATAVRVPVIGGHSESVNITLSKPAQLEEVAHILKNTAGVVFLEDSYPMPLNAYGSDHVFVGRLRQDHSHERSFNLWIVSDNLRKGAATNAVQIAEYLIANKINSKALSSALTTDGQPNSL